MPANPVPIDVKTKGQTWLETYSFFMLGRLSFYIHMPILAFPASAIKSTCKSQRFSR